MIFIYNPPTTGVAQLASSGNRHAKIASHQSPATSHQSKSAATETGITTITAKALIEVKDTRFTLGEIADLDGKDKQLLARLARVEIGASPLPGLSRPLYPGDIMVHLRAAQLGSLLDSKKLEIIAPSEMRVLRGGQDVSADEITQAALAAGQAAIKDIPNATLEAVAVNGKAILPAGKIRVIAGAFHIQPEGGAFTVPVTLMVDGKMERVVNVTLRMQRRLMALVATRTLEPHDVLEAKDVQLMLVTLPPGFVQPMTRLEDAIGKRMTRRVLPDNPLSATMLEVPPDMAANARLTIEYIYGSIHITAPGLARQAGKIGDTIRVYALDTHRELEAVIVDARTVQLQEAGE